jgi:leucyl/phenylalanyl-tRNA--protein transferase
MALDIKLNAVASLFSEGIAPQEPTRSELRRRREALLREPFRQRLNRVGVGLRETLRPSKLRGTLAALDLIIRDHSICALDLPDPDQALTNPDGLCGVTADLSPAAIIDAYSRGLHLGGSFGRPTWWSPSTRLVLSPGATRVSGKVRTHLHRRDLRVSFDRTPEEVIAACARPNAHLSRFGFGPILARAYAALVDRNVGHTVEVRDRSGALVAGILGLSMGRVFIIERLFGAPDSIDLALVVLTRHLDAWGYAMVDARSRRDLGRLGFAPVTRLTYRAKLVTCLNGGRPGRWQVDSQRCGLEAAPPPELRFAA